MVTAAALPPRVLSGARCLGPDLLLRARIGLADHLTPCSLLILLAIDLSALLCLPGSFLSYQLLAAGSLPMLLYPLPASLCVHSCLAFTTSPLRLLLVAASLDLPRLVPALTRPILLGRSAPLPFGFLTRGCGLSLTILARHRAFLVAIGRTFGALRTIDLAAQFGPAIPRPPRSIGTAIVPLGCKVGSPELLPGLAIAAPLQPVVSFGAPITISSTVLIEAPDQSELFFAALHLATLARSLAPDIGHLE